MCIGTLDRYVIVLRPHHVFLLRFLPFLRAAQQKQNGILPIALWRAKCPQQK
jgi:hypothetical protein